MSLFRSKICNLNFQYRHKVGDSSFTRNRVLNFPRVLTLILSKSRKSLQLRLNEFFLKLEELPVTASAFTQARSKFKHTAFIELNQDLVDYYYVDEDYNKYKGLRLLAIDGSKLRLPETEDIKKDFGETKAVTKYGCNAYVMGQSSVLYDVLNNIVIDARLEDLSVGERCLAMDHLKFTGKGDLVIMDRGYTGYELFASFAQQGSDFLVRCPTVNSFVEIRDLIGEDLGEKIVSLACSQKSKKAVQEKGLKTSIDVRFIKIFLPTGEIEVLATSLLDQDLYPIEEFKELYYKRWGVETFFEKIKGRLDLEAFTGKSAESVRQDFFSTIFVSNIETVYTEDIDVELKKKSQDNRHEQKVNKAVSFNIIKNHILDILFDTSISVSQLEAIVTKIFKTAPYVIRENRQNPRLENTPRKNNQWLRYGKKFVF